MTRGRVRGGHGFGTATAAAVAVALVVVVLVSGRGVDPADVLLGATSAVAILGLVAARPVRGPGRDPRRGEGVGTSVGDAEAALEVLDRELGRAEAYDAAFSVSVLELPRAVLADLSPRRADRLVAELASGIARDVRTGDRVCRVGTSDRDLVVVVLPDTGDQGAQGFSGRAVTTAHDLLRNAGIDEVDALQFEVLTHPADAAAIQRLQRRVAVVDGTSALVGDIPTGRRRTRAHGRPRAETIGH